MCRSAILLLCVLIGCFLPAPARGQEDERVVGRVEYDPLPATRPVGTQWLVLIAIDDYQNSRLDRLGTCRADAIAFRDLMISRFGYTTDWVIELYDGEATAAKIRQTFYALPDRVGTDDSVIIYFAGHGYYDTRRQMGFWYAADAQDVWDGIANSTVKDWCRALPAKKVLVIADSCFAGSLVTRAGFLSDATLKSRELLSSGGLHPVADSGSPDGRHSVFNHYLRQSLETLAGTGQPFVLTDLYVRIVPPVKANSRQEPQKGIIQDAFHEGGQFLFYPEGTVIGGETAPVTPVPIPTKAPVASVSAKRHQARERVSLDLGSGVSLHFVYIPHGTFMMGSEDGEEDERPVTRVTLTRGFWMGETEITQPQWEAIMGNNPSRFVGRNLPVDSVSWHQAAEYCEKLSASIGRKVSLPTEAQWEYACRAGTDGAFSFGPSAIVKDNRGSEISLIDDHAWYSENSLQRTHPVATKRPNAFGLYDMHGNVWEWCQDSYGSYPGGHVYDWFQTGGADAISRGGSWIHPPERLRCAYRGHGPPIARMPGVGLRVVMGE